jgi:hypothetical protein
MKEREIIVQMPEVIAYRLVELLKKIPPEQSYYFIAFFIGILKFAGEEGYFFLGPLEDFVYKNKCKLEDIEENVRLQ